MHNRNLEETNATLINTNVKFKDITLAQCTIPAGKSVPALPTTGTEEMIRLNVIGVKILNSTGSYDDGYLGAYMGNNGYVHVENNGNESRTYTSITMRVFYV